MITQEAAGDCCTHPPHSAALYECGVNKGDRQDIFRIFNSAIILLAAGGMEHFPNTSSLKHGEKHRGAIGIFGVKKKSKLQCN